jgi:ABC-2 type transport system permease protein
VSELVARRRGLIALSARESHRVLKLWTQTVVAPILSSFLFILVFGLSLGGRIKHIDGVDYDVFIVPGLIAMAMIQATYANNSASVFQARFDRASTATSTTCSPRRCARGRSTSRCRSAGW